MYLSKNVNLKPLQIHNFIESIRSKNLENGITGYIFENEGYFLQYIEGRKEKIDELLQKLQHDSRHKILYATSKIIDKRRCENWPMNHFTTTTAVEKMFFDLLFKENIKAVKSVKVSYGFLFRMFYKNMIWKISDQLHTVTRHEYLNVN